MKDDEAATATTATTAAQQRHKELLQERREQIQAWATQNLARVYNTGCKLAIADQEPKEIRQWAELMTRLAGAFPERQENPQAGLAVFQFNISADGVQMSARQSRTIENQAEQSTTDLLGVGQEERETPAPFQVRFSPAEDVTDLQDLLGMLDDDA